MLVVTASGVFGELQSTLNKIWKVKPSEVTLSRFVKTRAVSLGLVATLGFLLIVSLVASAGLTAVGTYFGTKFVGWPLILSILNFVISFVLLSSLFAAVYKLLPIVLSLGEMSQSARLSRQDCLSSARLWLVGISAVAPSRRPTVPRAD